MNEITPTKSKQPSHVPIDFPTGSGFLSLEWINEGHPLVNRTGRIFGTGYVGLVSGACLAEVGHHVVCVDVDAIKVENLKNGILPIWEPGLEALVDRNVNEGRLSFTTDAAHAVQHGQTKTAAQTCNTCWQLPKPLLPT